MKNTVKPPPVTASTFPAQRRLTAVEARYTLSLIGALKHHASSKVAVHRVNRMFREELLVVAE